MPTKFYEVPCNRLRGVALTKNRTDFVAWGMMNDFEGFKKG